jgi:hypothetical protein
LDKADGDNAERVPVATGFARGEVAEAEDDGADAIECLAVRALKLLSRACKEELAGEDTETEEFVEDLADDLVGEVAEGLGAKGTVESEFGDVAVVARLGTAGGCLCSSINHCGTCLI